ncbi:MAG: hypothetical protein Q4C90_01845 [Kocuria sp.]|uniref:hypothetical protein n=1 Tax=Kocuria TaxID=57493 RepID=UPI0026DBD83D|nr:hypothetical protein [Kocuria sp.]MDO4255904.1 hypothetical protein [Kocuria sp.]
MSTVTSTSAPVTTSKARSAAPAMFGGAAVAMLVALFSATYTLGISSGLATNLYFALNALSWAALAASVVASFGLGTALAGTIYGLAKKWALKQFVQW